MSGETLHAAAPGTGVATGLPWDGGVAREEGPVEVHGGSQAPCPGIHFPAGHVTRARPRASPPASQGA